MIDLEHFEHATHVRDNLAVGPRGRQAAARRVQHILKDAQRAVHEVVLRHKAKQVPKHAWLAVDAVQSNGTFLCGVCRVHAQ